MPVSPEHLSALNANGRLRRSHAADAGIEAGAGQETHTGAELFGIPPAGNHVSFTETRIVRMRGNQVCKHWLQVDLPGLLES